MQQYCKEHIIILSLKDLLNKGEKIYEKKGFEISVLTQIKGVN